MPWLEPSRWRAVEKPWHGGPPTITSTWFIPMMAAKVSGGRAVRSASSAKPTGGNPVGDLAWRFARRVATAWELKSMAALQSKPARSIPRVKPPQPQKRSMKVGRSGMELRENADNKMRGSKSLDLDRTMVPRGVGHLWGYASWFWVTPCLVRRL